MITFLYGENRYLINERLKEIISLKKKSGGNLLLFKFPEEDSKLNNFNEIKNKIDNQSIFGEKKLIIIKNPISDGNENFKKELKEFLEKQKNKGDFDLILVESGNFKKTDILLKLLLKKAAQKEEINNLENKQLLKWTMDEVKKRGGQMDIKAGEKLLFFVGDDMDALSLEIDKLISAGGKISEELVKSLTPRKLGPDIFEFIDYLGRRDKKNALRVLHEHLESGENEVYLLSMIIYQFRNILRVKNLLDKKYSVARITEQTKLHPFVVSRAIFLAKNFNIEDLKKIYRMLFEVDLSLKTGKVNPVLALDAFIAVI